MLLRGRRDGRGHSAPVVCPLLPAASLLWRAGVPEGPAPDTQPDAAAVHSGPCTAPATPGRTRACSRRVREPALRPRPSVLAPATLLLPDGPRPRAQPSSTTLSARWAQLLEAACVT